MSTTVTFVPLINAYQCPTIFARAGRQETIVVVGQDCDADHHLVVVVGST